MRECAAERKVSCLKCSVSTSPGWGRVKVYSTRNQNALYFAKRCSCVHGNHASVHSVCNTPGPVFGLACDTDGQTVSHAQNSSLSVSLSLCLSLFGLAFHTHALNQPHETSCEHNNTPKTHPRAKMARHTTVHTNTPQTHTTHSSEFLNAQKVQKKKKNGEDRPGQCATKSLQIRKTKIGRNR